MPIRPTIRSNARQMSSGYYSPGPATLPPFPSTNLQLRLEAEQIGIQLGLVDGASVVTWPDISGFLRTFSQATPSLQPKYRTGILAGQPVVRFDGADDRISGSTGIFNAITGDYTLLCVYNPFTVSGALGTVFNQGDAATSAGTKWEHLAGGSPTSGNMQADYRVGGAAAVVNTPQGLAWTWTLDHRSGSTLTLYVNNATTGSGTATLAGSLNGATTRAPSVGNTSVLNNPLSGDVALVALWSSALSLSERNQVAAYLAAKYAL